MKRKPNPNPLRAAIYTRVSTGLQEEEGSSLETQEKACRAHAEKHGLVVDEAHVYREVHTGAELWQRPELTKLREAMKRQEIGALVVHAIDRLSRDPVHHFVLISDAAQAGVDILFVTETLEQTKEGFLIHFVRGYAASIEREKIRERSMRGKRARVESGKVPNAGGDLYGYCRDRERGVRSIVQEQSDVVRRIFAEVVAGVPLRTVVRNLNSDGIPSPAVGRRRSGNAEAPPRWGTGVVQRILTNPAYKGDTYAWRTKRHPDTGRMVVRPESEWVRLPEGTTPAIVSPDQWQAAQDRLLTNKGEATRNQYRQYLLRGLITCAKCGQRLQSCPEGDRRVYRCSSKDRPTGSCGGRRVPADEVEGWVCEQIKQVLNDPSVIRAELERRQHAGPNPAALQELNTLRDRLADVQLQVDRLVDAYADGDLPKEELKKKMDERQKQRARIQAQIAEAEAQISQQETTAWSEKDLEAVCRSVATKVEQLGFAGWRLALEAFGVRVCANGCGRRKSPLDWRMEGSVPLPEKASDTHKAVVSSPSLS